MAYRGRPSKACFQCRTRKIRCDLRKPSCSQCSRANLACFGFRDTEQLRIKDESQITKQKALCIRATYVPRYVAISIHDRARDAFIFHYVTGFSNTYDVLETLNKPSAKHLTASIDAVSLAFFSFQSDCFQASRLAGERYLYALPLLNGALKQPDSVASDTTLLAVLLLDLFEKITNKNPRSAESWMTHVHGALGLVTLREDQPFRNYVGLRLSVRLSTNLLISCVAANAPVPSALMKLRSDLEPFLNRDDPKWQVSGLVVKYANLRGAIQSGRLSASDVVTLASDLDQEFVFLSENMPFAWHYTSTYLETEPGKVLEGHFDTYLSHFITQTWNVLRIMRILLNEIICLSHINTQMTSYSETIFLRRDGIETTSINSLAKDICASAPQYTVYQKFITNSNVHSETQKLRCYTLIFPLYVAGLYASPAAMIKPWVITHLRFVSKEIGVRKAGTVANILETADGTSIWDVYAMLGSYAFAA